MKQLKGENIDKINKVSAPSVIKVPAFYSFNHLLSFRSIIYHLRHQLVETGFELIPTERVVGIVEWIAYFSAIFLPVIHDNAGRGVPLFRVKVVQFGCTIAFNYLYCS